MRRFVTCIAAVALGVSACSGDAPIATDEPDPASAEAAEEPEPEPPVETRVEAAERREAEAAANPEPEPEPETEPAPEPASEPDGSEANPAPIGEGFYSEAGDWEVEMTAVDTDATDRVQAANQFNPDPPGTYVLLTVEAAYVGNDEGRAYSDLGFRLQGADARQYDTHACDAVLDDALSDEPTVTNGGEVAGDVCFSVPDAALDGDWTIFVEDMVSFDGGRSYFAE